MNEERWTTCLIALLASGVIFGVLLRMQLVSGANDGSLGHSLEPHQRQGLRY
ncbi:MAG: hypothetical protein L0387_33405 [Acidobacteria bacterium]|nr:hypothetical protein [Acidobacteriota bacterium]MCI0720545.1 hypothetical protein [Acidobacteriota bacterium]